MDDLHDGDADYLNGHAYSDSFGPGVDSGADVYFVSVENDVRDTAADLDYDLGDLLHERYEP